MGDVRVICQVNFTTYIAPHTEIPEIPMLRSLPLPTGFPTPCYQIMGDVFIAESVSLHS